MFFGLTIEKLIIIGVIAAFIVGPGRLPALAGSLRDFVRSGKQFVGRASEQIKQEVGVEEDIDWSKLDPRRYDPRRIIKEALLEPAPVPAIGRGNSDQDADDEDTDPVDNRSEFDAVDGGGDEAGSHGKTGDVRSGGDA